MEAHRHCGEPPPGGSIHRVDFSTACEAAKHGEIHGRSENRFKIDPVPSQVYT